MTAAQKIEQPANDHDDEITIERRVKAPAHAGPDVSRKTTTRLTKVDVRLLAIARGEVEPDDPFGGLIPIYDDDDALEVDEAWLMLDTAGPAPESAADADESKGFLGDTIPRVCMRASQLFALPLEQRSALFLSQIDGRRSVEDLIEICGLDDLSALEIVDELLRLGAIELR